MKNDFLEIKRRAVPILKRNGVIKAGIFGSYATGKASNKSDVDMLVEINEDISLIDFIDIKLELESALKRKVDLIEYDTIKSSLKEKILKEEKRIL